MRHVPSIPGYLALVLGLSACYADDPIPPSPDEVTCEGRKLLALPEDPAAHGPWPVGARTITVAGLATEVWYPAERGSEAGKAKEQYDLRLHLPAADQGKIPDAENPYQACDCVRDLPLDAAHGPYPLMIFIHGTAGFRTQSLTFMTHWASRGFIVVAADHPGMELVDILSGSFGFHQAEQAEEILDALVAPAGEAAFLEGHVASGLVAMSGHSAGGGAISGFGERAQVIVPMAAGGVGSGAALASALVLGAMNDGVVAYSSTQKGYQDSPSPKRLVGLAAAGHLAFSDICFVGRDRGGILQVALDHGVVVPEIVATLGRDGCGPEALPPEKSWPIVQFATSAVLEEVMSCGPSGKVADMKAAYPDVGELLEDL